MKEKNTTILMKMNGKELLQRLKRRQMRDWERERRGETKNGMMRNAK